MLAQNFKSATDLGLNEKQHAALVTTLGMLERGDLAYSDECDADAGWSGKPPSHFNMGAWSIEARCGTVCCIGGTAEAVGNLKIKELWDLAEQLGSVGKRHLYDLFFVPMYDDYETIAVDKAARALRNFLTHGEPRWAEVLKD